MLSEELQWQRSEPQIRLNTK